jgi:hypothetical protein
VPPHDLARIDKTELPVKRDRALVEMNDAEHAVVDNAAVGAVLGKLSWPTAHTNISSTLGRDGNSMWVRASTLWRIAEVTMIEVLTIALDSWIIQDGNYGEFQTGDVTTFAVEFWTQDHALALAAPAPAGPSIQHVTDATYRIHAPIVYLAPRWWVIDIGIPVFQEQVPPAGTALGQWVQGEINLGIDPFFYFERLAQARESPPLIFEWTIDAIDMQTAPIVETSPGIRARDPARHGWKRIAQTDAWHDDTGDATYLLHCRLKNRAPRHSLTA